MDASPLSMRRLQSAAPPRDSALLRCWPARLHRGRASAANALCHFHSSLQHRHASRHPWHPVSTTGSEGSPVVGPVRPPNPACPRRHGVKARSAAAAGGSMEQQPDLPQPQASIESEPSGVPGLLSQWTAGMRARLRQVQLPGWLQGLLYYREIILRAALTVGLLVVIRAGHFVPLPGVDLQQVPAVAASTPGERLIRALYGQAGDLPASIFDLGISPFVNASIILAMAIVLPSEVTTLPLPGATALARIKEARKEGRSGEAVINGYMNNLALGFAVVGGLMRALDLQSCALYGGALFVPQTVLALVSGSCIIHMCANTITHFGLGNGSSLVICAGIISEYAATLHTVLSALDSALVSAGLLGGMLGGYLLLVLLAVCLATSELRLPVVQYASSAPPPPDAAKQGGGMQELFAQARLLAQKKVLERGHKSDYFPLQLNSSGMMSIILGGAAYFGFLPKLLELCGEAAAAAWLQSVQLTPVGLLGYGLLVACLEFLPLGGINPKEMAEYFNMMNVGLRGVVPGEPTERELRMQLLRCKFWGGMCLGVLAVAAQLYDMACASVLGTSLATTSLLIIVGAVLQTARQVEGLLEGPKLQRKLDMERRAIESLSVL